LSRFTPQTYIGASAEGAEIMTFLAPPVKWAEALETQISYIKSGSINQMNSLLGCGEDTLIN